MSSSVLAGLALGGGTGINKRMEVVIDANALGDSRGFCLQVLTRDGQFWSENPFRPASGNYPSKVKEITVKHWGKLKNYDPQDLLVAAGLTQRTKRREFGKAKDLAAKGDGVDKACESDKRVYVPAFVKQTDFAGPLVAYVNSEGRYTETELWQNNKLVVSGKCRQPELQATVIFDQVCKFKLPKIAKAGVFEIRFIFDAAPFGTKEWKEFVILSAN